MASPRTVIHISEANGSIKRLTDGIAFIDQEADTRNIHLTGTLLSSFQKSLSYALTAVLGENGQGVKVQFACLRFIIHPGMVFAKMNHSSLDEGTAQFRQSGTIVTDCDTYDLISIHCDERILIAVLRIHTLYQHCHRRMEVCKAAKIYMCAKAMGSEPEGMTDEAMQEVQRVFNLPKKRIG